MGLDISLLEIAKEKTNDLDWFLVEDCPELKERYKGFAKEKDFNLENELIDRKLVYYYTEISYQRKGVKRSYYNRYDADTFIQTQEEFNELIDYILDDFMDTFTKDFITKFREGENLIFLGY